MKARICAALFATVIASSANAHELKGYLYTSLNGEGTNQVISFERYDLVGALARTWVGKVSAIIPFDYRIDLRSVLERHPAAPLCFCSGANRLRCKKWRRT